MCSDGNCLLSGADASSIAEAEARHLFKPKLAAADTTKPTQGLFYSQVPAVSLPQFCVEQ